MHSSSSSSSPNPTTTTTPFLLSKPTNPLPIPIPSLTSFLISLLLLLLLITSLYLFSPSPFPPNPSLILISFDGFRFGYHLKTPTPNIHRLLLNGTSAFPGLIPVFPSFTFPNHYSIATGLFPPYHGIISNSFSDPSTNDTFSVSNHQPKWWLGEPIWETVANHNLSAAVYFWAGGEVKKGSWTCPKRLNFCPKYNQSVPFEERVDTVLGYYDLKDEDRPVFTALYFSDPDSQGHLYGPDHPEITKAVAHLDRVLGRLIDGLERRGVLDGVTIMLVGDHGMVGVCENKFVFLEDLMPWIEIKNEWVQSQWQLLAIRPPEGVEAKEVVERMNEGLGSGKVENGERLRVYLKEDLPERLHYCESDRIPPIIGLVEEGYTVEVSRRQGTKCGGDHGYDNELFSMRSIFIGHGPRFEKGRKIPSFVNVEIYNLMTEILGLKGAPNNGSDAFAKSVLLPRT